MTTPQGELLLAIESIGFSDTFPYQRFLLGDLRTRCSEGASGNWADPDGTALIRAFASGLSRVATSQYANELLSNQHVEVVRTDLCNACVALTADGSVIFVFRGLIKAIMFVLEFGEIIRTLDTHLKAEKDCPYSRDQLHALAYAAYSSLYHYQASGEPLPRAGDVLLPTEKRSQLIQFSRVIWFILMHEIGHVQLGHLRPGTAISTLAGPKLAVAESLNNDKLKEFEADLFLCKTLRDTEQYAVMSYVLAPIDLLASLERHLGENQDTHPSAVNRLQHILNTRNDALDDISRELVAQVVSRDIAALQTISDRGHGSRIRIPVEESHNALEKLKDLYSGVAENPNMPSEADMPDAALWDFAVGYFWHDGALDPSGRLPKAE